MKKDQMFRERVLQIVSRIPKGSVMTYGEVAFRAGYPGAARAVGRLMSQNFDPSIPCHRVVSSNGIGGYNRGMEVKRKILEEEGVSI
ncbi:methylated-DNA--[protein]-cysteine S-methyltransferase [Candidatus Peregrinibacteria bacterium]|nr:methylated-DNA--[protein]-cysteine S-methyltransferase [Candidatus Peregrinibacteria bacterium]